MSAPSFFGRYTIRQHLIVLNIITLGLIFSLISIYTYQVISLENKLVTMEQIDDISNNILNIRRLEKNILLGLNSDSVQEVQRSLQKLNDHLQQLTLKSHSDPEKKLFQSLEWHFQEYNIIFNRWSINTKRLAHFTQEKDSQLIRIQGQKMADDAIELVRLKRTSTSQGFKRTLFWLTLIPTIILITGALIFFTQTKNILDRLSSLKKATRDLASGEFKQIPTLNGSDEISNLISTFNQMVQALEEKQEQLIQSKKMASIGTFSSGIAHEINNPLNNISLSTDTLIEEFNSMEEDETREILNDIMDQTERASSIVRNLLDFSRAQSAEMQRLYIDFVLHKSTELIANELSIHKITLKKDITDLLPQINGDLQQLQQVFLNLIINAEQAIGDNGIITVRAEQTENGYIRADICDNGPGIAQEHLDQIFDPFFTTKEAGKGTGLGLAIVYGIVQKHGGYIEVASKIGGGTTFSVHLPIYKDKTQLKQVTS